MKESAEKLRKRLRSLRGRWRRGVFLSFVFRTIATFLGAILILAFLDYLFALSSSARIAGLAVVYLITLIVFVRGLIKIGKMDLTKTAQRVDNLGGVSGRPALSALELSGDNPKTPLAKYLTERAIASSGDCLDGVSAAAWRPSKLILGGAGIMAAAGALIGLCFILFPQPSAVIASRLYSPTEDIPPYSKLKLLVSGDALAVVYGEDITLNVEVEGDRGQLPVVFAARRAGKVSETPCFDATGGRFSQRLENVVAPVEFAFKCGRARSRWFKVDVLLQPKFASAAATLRPPKYSGLEVRKFAAGEEPIAGLAGTEVEVVVGSNRPLASGTLKLFDPEVGSEPVGEVAGEPLGGGRLTFRWQLVSSADLEIQIRDIAGTPATEPLRLRQRKLPDAAPEAEILSPGNFALATPDSVIPFEARATDDYGLRSLDLVRGLGAYRQRVRTLDLPKGGEDGGTDWHNFEAGIDLAKVGAKNGHSLEYFLEVTDHNPDFSGSAASPSVHIEVISTEEYRQIIQDRTTIEEFAARYRAAENALAQLEEALRNLEKVARENPGDAEKTDPAILEAIGANVQAEGLMAQLGRDFAAFDVEQNLVDEANAMGVLLNEMIDRLDALDPESPDLADAAAKLLEEISPGVGRVNQQVERAEEIASVGTLIKLAVEFRKLHADQLAELNRMRRFDEDPQFNDQRLMNSLANRQRELADTFDKMREDIVKAAQELPDDFAQLKDDSLKFAMAMESTDVASEMRASAGSAEDKEGKQMFHHATRAEEDLAKLLSMAEEQNGEPGNCLAGLACGQSGSLNAPPDVKSTLEQMLQSLMRRLNGGSQNKGVGGSGGSFGSHANNGFGGGTTSLNYPVFGPERMSFGPSAMSGRGSRGSGGSGRVGKGPVAEVEHSEIKPAEGPPPESPGYAPEEVPEKYRDAVRRFLSREDG